MSRNPKLVSFQRSPAYVHHRAMLNRRDNNIVDALELMRRAVEESPDNREYRLDLAELYCEMGCHNQSSRLLLDMLAEEDCPSECYYGLALNQLGMNDVSGARRLLEQYCRRDPEGAHSEEVSQLSAELDFYADMNRPASRRLHRAMRIADRACEAMKADDAEKACRLFEKSLAMASEQYEMRSLYAMALLMKGEREAAKTQAEAAVAGYPPSVRALCVAAQVFAMLGDDARANELVDRAMAEKPDGQDLRLMIYAMGEMRMHAQVAEYARLALQETPFDRDLIHMRAVALKRTGTSDARLERFWSRILRIDPDDSIAAFYRDAAHCGALDDYAFDYSYQVPPEEFRRRIGELIAALGRGFEAVEALWREDPQFRQLVRWAIDAEDGRLSRAAMTALTAIDSDESRSVLRELLFSAGLSTELKLHAALALRLQGLTTDSILPSGSGLSDGLLPDADALIARLTVGERQLVRYADEVLEYDFGVSARMPLTLMWSTYRQMRGTHADPLRCIDAASAALAYNYLMLCDKRPDVRDITRAFHCDMRQMVYYARRIAACLERIVKGELTPLD